MRDVKLMVVDYGLGNLFNIQNAFSSLGVQAELIEEPAALKHATHVVLPGVGAFVDGMKGLCDRGFDKALKDFASTGRPMMGICLGMQLMLRQSEEWGYHSGLGLVNGKVVKLRAPLPGQSFKIPHIGWNTLELQRRGGLFSGVEEMGGENGLYLYFLHSYFAVLDSAEEVVAITEFGRDKFCSAFQAGNIFGIQPHAERSGRAGLKLFSNFLAWKGN